jgi:hypothetical protein
MSDAPNDRPAADSTPAAPAAAAPTAPGEPGPRAFHGLLCLPMDTVMPVLEEVRAACDAVQRTAAALAAKPFDVELGRQLRPLLDVRDAALLRFGQAIWEAGQGIEADEPPAAGPPAEPVPAAAEDPVQGEPVAASAVAPLALGGDEGTGGAPAAPAELPAEAVAAPPVAAPPGPAELPPAQIPAPPPGRSAPPAARVDVTRLGQHFARGGAFHPENGAIVRRLWPVGAIQALGWPPALTSPADLRNELIALQRAFRDRRTWGAGGDLNDPPGAILSVLAARARALQDAPGAAPLKTAIEKLFQEMTQFSQKEQPGFVVGLNRGHRPSLATWTAEAEARTRRLRDLAGMDAPAVEVDPFDAFVEAFERADDAAAVVAAVSAAKAAGLAPSDRRLIELLLPFADELQGLEIPKTTKKALKEALADDAPEAEAPAGFAVDPELRAITAGMQALIIGGDERSNAKAVLAEAFGFAALDWDRGHNVRRVSAAAERLRQGRYGLVIFLQRFLSHRLTDLVVPTVRSEGVPMAWVPRGYNPAQVQEALRAALLKPAAAR